jgi:N-acyl homoserine lactone hydrolase
VGTAERLFFVQFGAQRISKRLSLANGPHHLYWEPVFGALVQTSDGWILLDTGMSRAAHDSDVNHAVHAGKGGDAGNFDTPWHLYPAPPNEHAWDWGLDGDPLRGGLAEVGLAASDIALAAITHLHVDHSGGIPALAAAGVPVAIQGRELDFVHGGTVGMGQGFHEPDWSAPGTSWRVLDGDTELAPGVWALATPGHTPGHMSFRVDLPETGTWLLAGDAADLAQNFLDNVPCGSCAGKTPGDEADAAESLRRLLELAKATDARLIPGHDQIVLNAIRHPPGGHR